MDNTELYPIEELRQEIMAATALNSDLDYAFILQMQEAITASLVLQPSPSHSPPKNDNLFEGEDVEFDYTDLLLEDVKRLDQERRDYKECEVEGRKMKEVLDLRLHDHKFAKEISDIPDHEWESYGDYYQKPYGEGSCFDSNPFLVENECFRLYFKGLVREEIVRDVRVRVAGVGVAICDSTDIVIWEVKKGLEHGDAMSDSRAELEALIIGLDAALSLDLRRIALFSDASMACDYVTGVEEPRQSCIATLVQQVACRQRKFIYCEPSLVSHNDIKFAYKLARDAITSQISWPIETSEGKSFKETCVICYEDVDVEKMFSVDGCYHRYCFSCMKQHVEVKLHNGMVANCPSEGCQSEVKIESCKKFLDHKLVEVMSQRIKEASVAFTEKVYCPYPKCSTLMSKTEVLKYTKQIYVGAEQSGARACMSCHYYFCINCMVPWHSGMNCADYSKSGPQPSIGDAKLKSLAKTKRWRQCMKCSHMVELAEGCYHITCRCGHEFCYTCGAEWKKKKPTCKCPIWDESNIIRG